MASNLTKVLINSTQCRLWCKNIFIGYVSINYISESTYLTKYGKLTRRTTLSKMEDVFREELITMKVTEVRLLSLEVHKQKWQSIEVIRIPTFYTERSHV